MNPLLALTPPGFAAHRTEAPPFTFSPGGTQFLAVSGTLTDRLLVTFRAEAHKLRALVPAPFELDTYAGYGFLSVCAVEIAGMGLAGTPRFMRWQNREFLYRLGVRLHGQATFITLRSDVSSRLLALLGRHFSHYRPQLAAIELVRNAQRLRMAARNGNAEVEVDLATAPPPGSVFADEAQAADFLLGQKFSADVARGRVRVQPIEHAAWRPRFVATRVARFELVEQLGQRLGARFELDSTLAVHDVPHVWKAAKWL
jgi:uncharacterized protein YqjF (DUF2071 family)